MESDGPSGGGRVYQDRHERLVAASVDRLWSVIEGFGGENGWYSPIGLWQARGVIDRAVGGPGLRRGRPDPRRLTAGDALDFWRVEKVRRPSSTEPGLLLLRAEMRMPGTAWLEMRAEPAGTSSRYVQRSLFAPAGLRGRLYWMAELPMHLVVFADMARNIGRAAQR